MQKLAVALTTQEEFNDYMVWRENKAWRIYASMEFDTKNVTCVLHNKLWWIWPIQVYEKYPDEYKIISLKEAIGEKEDIVIFEWPYHPMNWNLVNTIYRNKEIIREGEARGFEHKTLGRKAIHFKTDIVEWYKISDKNWLLVFWDNRITADKLPLLWFEPIEEPKRDWIDKAFENYDSNKLLWKSKYAECFREAIEKHMPRITHDELWELDDYYNAGIRYVLLSELLEVLKSKWLLE